MSRSFCVELALNLVKLYLPALCTRTCFKAQAVPAPRSALLQKPSSCGSSTALRAGNIQTCTYSKQVRLHLSQELWQSALIVFRARLPRQACERHLIMAISLSTSCAPVLLGKSSFRVLAGQAEGADIAWRGLYACGNGWRKLQPGCFDVLDMPNCSRGSTFWGWGYPPHCILVVEDLGWTEAAGGASELLVAVDWLSVQVTLPWPFSSVCFAHRRAPG